MKVIYKYELEILQTQKIKMNEGAIILSVKNQDNKICLWAEVDNELPLEYRYFDIIGTGNPIYEDIGVIRHFWNTVQIDNFVWHVYERL